MKKEIVVQSMRARLRQATQQKVLCAAGKLFLRKGFTGTTIRDIAEESDVSVGTVMSTGDKTGLLVQIFDEMIEAEHEGLQVSTIIADNNGDLVECLMAITRPFTSMIRQRRELAQAYASTLVLGNHSSAAFTSLADILKNKIREVLVGLKIESQATADASSQAIFALFMGVVFQWLSDGDESGEDLDADLRAVFVTAQH
jgi:AcrR family transcriptional regulator